MARVLLIISEGGAGEAAGVEALPRAGVVSGPLSAAADSQAVPVLLESVLRAGATMCLVGAEWLAHAGTLRGVAVAYNGNGLRVLPDAAAERVRRLCGPAQHHVALAEMLILNEPWDLFALWLKRDDAVETDVLHRLAAEQTADVTVIAISSTAWVVRAAGAPSQTMPACRFEDLLATALASLGAPIPEALGATPLALNQPAASGGYTTEDERVIQQRLEDLGYL